MSMISKMKSMLGVEEFDEEFDDFAEGEELEENDIEDEIEPIILGMANFKYLREDILNIFEVENYD